MVSQSDVARFALQNQAITKLLANGKLQFSRTGMEFPANAKYQVLEAYAGGRAYRRAIWALENKSYDFAQHEPYIVPHKYRKGDHFLFCKLTNSTIPRRKDSVEKHVAGKKFRKRLKAVENAQRERVPKQSDENQASDAPPEARGAREVKETQIKDSGDIRADVNEEIDANDMDFESMSIDNEIPVSRRRLDERKAAEEKDKEEGGGVFWTRGPERNDKGAHEDDEVDDGSEWAKLEKPRVASTPHDELGNRVQSTPRLRSDQGKASLPLGNGINESASTGKRKRSSKPVKKVRRPRQRRKGPAQS